MKLLNTTLLDGKQYTDNDIKGFESLETHNIPTGFYGGRVDKLAKTNIKGLYMCMEGMKVIDLLIEEPENKLDGFDSMTNKELVELLKEKGIEVPKKYTKQELLALL